jgi:outer membrane protein assembly factor BamD
MRRAMRDSGRVGGRSGLAVLAALALGGCGGIDASGMGGGLADYVWGDSSSSKSSGTATATALSSGDAIAPDMGNVDDAEPIAKHYNAGLGHLNRRNFRSASESFAEVERQHPYSIWATRAILMQAYAQYMRNSYDDAINAAQRFIALHPGHKDAPYAYYLVALSHYEQISDVKRDQTATTKALESLDEIARRFPGTPYARDAEAKAVLARDHLAGKEMEIGRYYLDQSAYLASINRFKTVVTDYQTTTHVPEALYRLTETYLALGVQSEAQTAAAVLGHNYPGSQWYKDAYALLGGQGLEPYKSEDSWISRAINTVNPFSG